MKKTISLREFIMLGVLIIIVVYYFALHVPINNETADLDAQLIEIQDEIDISTTKLMSMKSMQKEIDAIYEESGGNPPELAKYNNVNEVILELNAILASAENYSINFGDEQATDYIVRRDINMNFQTADYGTALKIITAIHDSPLRYLIKDLSITTNTSSNLGELLSVQINIVCYEYNPQQISDTAAAQQQSRGASDKPGK